MPIRPPGPRGIPSLWPPIDAVAATDLPILLLKGGADGDATDARAFQAALVASGYHSQLIEIPAADHFGTTVAKESIEAILDLATAP